MPNIHYTSQYNSANQTHLKYFNSYKMDSTNTLSRNVPGLSMLKNRENLPSILATSKDIRTDNETGFNSATKYCENRQLSTTSTQTLKHQSNRNVEPAKSANCGVGMIQISDFQAESTGFPINMPNIQISSQYYTQLSNLDDYRAHSTHTNRRNVHGLNLLDKFSATIQPDNNSSTSDQVGIKRNAAASENILCKKKHCPKSNIVSTSESNQCKKTKLMDNLNDISQSMNIDPTQSASVNKKRNVRTKKNIVPTSNVNFVSPSQGHTSNFNVCPKVGSKRNVDE